MQRQRKQKSNKCPIEALISYSTTQSSVKFMTRSGTPQTPGSSLGKPRPVVPARVLDVSCQQPTLLWFLQAGVEVTSSKLHQVASFLSLPCAKLQTKTPERPYRGDINLNKALFSTLLTELPGAWARMLPVKTSSPGGPVDPKLQVKSHHF